VEQGGSWVDWSCEAKHADACGEYYKGAFTKRGWEWTYKVADIEARYGLERQQITRNIATNMRWICCDCNTVTNSPKPSRHSIPTHFKCSECRKKDYRQAPVQQSSAEPETDYQAYLKTEHWKQTTESAKRRAGYKCALCGKGKDSVKWLATHHNTYDNRGRELPEDLVVLCNECHDMVHNKTEEDRDDAWKAVRALLYEAWMVLPEHIRKPNEG